MAKNPGWWGLQLTNGNTHDDLSDSDREMIAQYILDGFGSGFLEANYEDDDENEDQELSGDDSKFAPED
jgi:hypothetical protein